MADLEGISAITFAVRDMARSIDFYQRLGFVPTYGDADASFTSLRLGGATVNLTASAGRAPEWWGRVIFRVRDVDAYRERLAGAGLHVDQPVDAPWGERFFHVSDPDGHELSFAAVLTG